VAAVLTLGVGSALAADAVTNGSFETGDFSGWTTTDPGEPCTPWSVFASPSAEWCFTAFDSDWPEDLSATDGSSFADVTWDGDGTSGALLAQSVSVPADRSATLTWADNTSWDLTFGAKRPRFEYVDILSSDGSTVLHSYVIRVLAPRTEGATGWVTHTLRLSGYGG
jgi:hypothetical protein